MPRAFGVDRDMLSLDQVAAKLGKNRFWFLRNDNRQRLRELGFPEPVAGLGRVWDPEAIDFWLDQRLPEEQRQARRVVQATNDNEGGDRRVLSDRDLLRKQLQEKAGAQ